MKRKIIKLAIIRSDDSEPCPFGLSIPFGCKNAGNIIRKMAPLDILGDDTEEEEQAEIAEANNHLLRWKNPQMRCRYAGKVFPKNDVVECNWDTNTMGVQEQGVLRGSPFFYRHFSGIGLDGVFTYPLGYYTDNSIDRGMYQGMYSIESTGQIKNDHIKKDMDDETEKEKL